MKILLLEIDLHLPASQSLKDKRSSVKSIIDRLRNTLNVSVAEVDDHDLWQSCTLALVTVSMLEDRVEATARQAVDDIERRFDVRVMDVRRQWL